MNNPQILAAGIFDTAKGLVTDAQSLLNLVVVLVICVLLIIINVKGGFSFGKLIMSGLAGAFIAWMVIGGAGMLFFSKQISETVKSAPAPIIQISEHELDRRV